MNNEKQIYAFNKICSLINDYDIVCLHNHTVEECDRTVNVLRRYVSELESILKEMSE